MKKMTITGNIGRDAEIRVNNRGEEFATFSVAVRVGTKDNPRTDWVDVVCGGKLSAIAKLFVKSGGKILVEGFPNATGWLKDGVIHTKIRINAQTIELLGRPTDDEETPAFEENTPDDADIPF